MRTGAPAGHRGYYHEALQYASDDEFLSVAVPFLLDGVAAGEPSIVVLGTPSGELLRDALPARCGVGYLTGGATYDRPVTAIRDYRAMLAACVADGAEQIRIVGEVPSGGSGDTWRAWARYESAINVAFDDFPLWSLCTYDERRTSAQVRSDVARTHPRFARPGGASTTSTAFAEPSVYLSEQHPLVPDPLQAALPHAELHDPSPAQARAAVRDLGAGLTPDDLDDLLVGVSEAVTNAMRYGRSPVRLRVWSTAGRLVVTVTDAGDGPKDPFAGLLPAAPGQLGGRGLWITHQACAQVSTARDTDGWTIRMIAGRTVE
ncbi:anti-sigma factor RsbA family regulatory protein [Winogradskya consettensis]|uniref:Anti-sigma regulatory factor n=1 Tax=Winogradskya consettensis TaxID=113560 RepID=A0A919VR58_9ACTN|nr:anti-sigma factor RsbA family regulatory protein [Actinoplanes consettensis]GIM73346.1 anti-sigma regulatory factor [Actinoplanes consettensis]